MQAFTDQDHGCDYWKASWEWKTNIRSFLFHVSLGGRVGQHRGDPARWGRGTGRPPHASFHWANTSSFGRPSSANSWRKLLAYLDDITVLTTIGDEFARHAQVSIHHGKTQVWSGATPPGVEELTRLARLGKPEAVVWRGDTQWPWPHLAKPVLAILIWPNLDKPNLAEFFCFGEDPEGWIALRNSQLRWLIHAEILVKPRRTTTHPRTLCWSWKRDSMTGTLCIPPHNESIDPCLKLWVLRNKQMGMIGCLTALKCVSDRREGLLQRYPPELRSPSATSRSPRPHLLQLFLDLCWLDVKDVVWRQAALDNCGPDCFETPSTWWP